MNKVQHWYYLERARTSLEASRQAQDPGVAAIHLELCERYMALATQPIEPDGSSARSSVVPPHGH